MDARPAELTRIGAYRVHRQVGEGGMGVVYLGTGPDGRAVAIKMLRPWLVGGADGRRRFAREVATLARVRGPRVAEILDADVGAEPPYVVTRYVDGVPLTRQVARHGPLPGQDLRVLARGLLDALATVHGAGVVHRDVKPGNVLLAADGPVLIDFGIAHATDDTRLTATGFISGTPGYFAPETVLGRHPTPATDVHGWAATVTYAAIGRSPYGSGPDLAVIDRIRRGEHDLTGVEPWLVPVLDAALHADPGHRPSVAAAAAALAGDDAPTVSTLPGAAATVATPAPAFDDTVVIPPVPPVPPPPPPPPPGEAATVRQPPVSPAPQRPAQQPSPLAVPPPRSGADPTPRRWRPRLAIALGRLLLLLLIAASPVAGAVAALLMLLTGRVVWRQQRRLHERREARGQQRGDPVLAAFTAPWDVVASLLPCLAQLLVAGVGAAVVGVLLDLLDVGGSQLPSVGAAAAASWLLWRGPGTVLTRHGIKAIAAPLERSPRAAWVVLGVLFVATCGTVLVFDSFGGGWPADVSLEDVPGWPD